MEIKDNGELFYIGDEKKPDANIIYVVGKKALNIKHTYVDPESRGKGYAAYLMKYAIDFAKDRNLKVKPMCAYSTKYFDTHPELDDILYKG